MLNKHKSSVSSASQKAKHLRQTSTKGTFQQHGQHLDLSHTRNTFLNSSLLQLFLDYRIL